MKNIAEVLNDSQYGALIQFKDLEAADEFDDFLTEENFVLYQTKFENDKVTFYFGQVSSYSKLENLLRKFLERERK